MHRMTITIKKAIGFIHAYMHPTSSSNPHELKKLRIRNMAIHALESYDAIEESFTEIMETTRSSMTENTKQYYGPYLDALRKCMDIVHSKKLEVEEIGKYKDNEEEADK